MIKFIIIFYLCHCRYLINFKTMVKENSKTKKRIRVRRKGMILNIITKLDILYVFKKKTFQQSRSKLL